MDPIQGVRIWECPKPFNMTQVPDPKKIRLEFPDLVRFKGQWYCGFREARIHENHPSGKGRIIRSADGRAWESVALIEWDGADAGTPRFSVTAEGKLMVTSTLLFVSKEPRSDGYYYQLDRKTLGLGLVPHSDLETDVACQSVTWLSSDGENWGSAYACPTAVNTNRFNVTWHNGMGYSIAQWGKNTQGTLYRTRDGKSWRILLDGFFPEGHAGEGALAFDEDDTAHCLLRGDSRMGAFLGVGKPPYYQEWKWAHPLVDYGPEHGGARPASDVLGVGLGGPNLIRLSDGRLLGAGRALGPGRDDGHATLFWIDPNRATMTLFAEFDGTSYPGVAEHDGTIWVTYIGSACHQEKWEVHLAKVGLPD